MPNQNAGADRRPYRVFVRNPESGLLTHDGLIYRGERCAQREARKIARVLGLTAEARAV
jgi:hypothetical protein